MQLSMRPSARIMRAIVALGGSVACFAACNASSTGIFSDSAGPQGGFSGSGVSTSVSPTPGGAFPGNSCPAKQPFKGESCFEGTCEYGGSADPSCNVIARCNAATKIYEIEQPTHCPTTCPAHFDERAPGTTCSGTELCTYLEATCGCAGAIDGAWTSIQGGSNDIGDAGTEASTADGGGDGGSDGGDGGSASAAGHWECVRPGNGCPARRPVEGAHCTTPMDCDYGSCVFGLPLAMTCIGERWTARTIESCP